MPQFIKAVSSREFYPEHQWFECCLIGRSNVGKSSLINALAKQKIAYISKSPGRTQTINFYDFNSFWLIDLPGYGYAKVNQDKKQFLAIIGEEYLTTREQLMSVIHVCDINVISDLDVEMKNYLKQKFDNYILCLNKIDKLSYSQQQKQLKLIATKMNLTQEQLFLISAKKRINTDKLLNKIKFWTKK